MRKVGVMVASPPYRALACPVSEHIGMGILDREDRTVICEREDHKHYKVLSINLKV